MFAIVGMYEDASDANVAAVVADEKWVKKEGICNYYTGYRIHNMHFVAYASMFAGMIRNCQQYVVLYNACAIMNMNALYGKDNTHSEVPYLLGSYDFQASLLLP